MNGLLSHGEASPSHILHTNNTQPNYTYRRFVPVNTNHSIIQFSDDIIEADR